jgi:UDP-glucose 4-epimerase
VRWLITGGCGFVGCALIRRLTADDANGVRVLDNLVAGAREDLEKATGRCAAIDPITADVRDAPVVSEAARGCDVIVHLAASTGVQPSVEDPQFDCAVNVLGTLNVLEAARHHAVRQVVFASSGALIGECDPPIHEDKPARPVSPYGASKLAGEGYCSAYYHTFGIKTVALRFGNVYGPGSAHKESAVARFTKRALARLPLEIYGDGGQTRDFIFVEDLVDAILCAVQAPGVGGEAFQIATERETSVNELVEELLPILREYLPWEIEVVHLASRKGDVRRNFSDTSKAQRLLGWRARTPLSEGLRRTVVDLIQPLERAR